MKIFLLTAALFGFGTFISPQSAQSADPYYGAAPGPSYVDGDRGSYSNNNRSLKDPAYTPPYAPSYKDQPYNGNKGGYGYRLPKSNVQYYGNGYRNGYCVPRRQIRQNLRRIMAGLVFITNGYGMA